MIRSPFRKALLVSALALVAFAGIQGSAGAQPGPDDDPNYSDPMWIYANPAARVETQGTYVLVEGFYQLDPSRKPQPHWTADEQVVGGR